MKNKVNEVLTDNQLVENVINGDDSAFEQLIARYESRIFSIAMRYTHSQQDSEEILQDVFISVYRNLASFEGKSAFSSWLHRITINATFMKIRKLKQNKSECVEDLNTNLKQEYYEAKSINSSRADTKCMNDQLKTALADAISALPEEYGKIYVMRDVDGLSNQEVSDLLKVSIPAVKSRLHRARLMLRKKLKNVWAEFEKYGSDLMNGASVSF